MAHLVKKRADSQNIPSVKDSSGHVQMDSNGINKVFAEFYERLYTSEQPAEALMLMENFFSNLTLPKPNDEQKSDLNKPITSEEVNEAVCILQSGKAPGPDGFSSEFFKQFRSLMVKPLLNMFNHSLKTGALPKTLAEANISWILKKDKPGDECSSYRPISLLNTDFKILSKILALRLEKTLPHIINNDQTGFITGRNSRNNDRRLLNIIQLCQQKHLKGMVVSLDAEKAFDRIEWDFLFFTLKELV